MQSPPAPSPPAHAPGGLLPRPGGVEEVLYDGPPALIPSIGALLLVLFTLGLALVWFWARRAGTRYRITTQRIVIDRGLFSKRMEQIDLYRVVDYVVERPFGQRLLGNGNLILEAMDKTTPELRIVAIPTDVVALYERLRVATEAARQGRGVRLLDVEQP